MIAKKIVFIHTINTPEQLNIYNKMYIYIDKRFWKII